MAPREVDGRRYTRRSVLRHGGASIGVVTLCCGRAVAADGWGGFLDAQSTDSGQSPDERLVFATRNAVENEGFAAKPFWLERPNGTAVTPDVDDGRRDSAHGTYVGWRAVESGVERAADATKSQLTTVFLPTTRAVDAAESPSGSYRLEDVATAVVGRITRANGNHTTERVYRGSLVSTGE